MRRALGRGLSQLIAEEFEAAPAEIPVSSIDPNPRQPRSTFDEEALLELADSIKEHGILQPLVVRAKGDGRYELIAGERRLRASKLAGLKTVPYTVREADNQHSLELAIIENVQREDIGPMEKARAYRRLMDEFELTQDDVSQKVGKARASVANTLRLLRLPERIQGGLEAGRITEGHAKALLATDNAKTQEALYDRIVEEGLNVREIERLMREPAPTNAPAKAPTVAKEREPIDPNWQVLEDSLSTYFGSRVRLVRSETGGRMVVEFYSDDDFQRILDILGFNL